MFTTRLRCTKMLFVLTALSASLASGLDALTAGEPELVEMTLLFRMHPFAAETFPDPSGDDAIGLVLDGNNISAHSPSVYVAGEVFAGFPPGSYSPTDAIYITKGGVFAADVYTHGYIPPAHGFINLKKSLILESVGSFATSSGSTLVEEYDPPSASDYIFLVHGWFEVHSRQGSDWGAENSALTPARQEKGFDRRVLIERIKVSQPLSALRARDDFQQLLKELESPRVGASPKPSPG